MRIGYHLLDGKQVLLKAPLAVLESQPVEDGLESSSSKRFQVGHRVSLVGFCCADYHAHSHAQYYISWREVWC